MKELNITTETIDWDVLYLRHTGGYEALGNVFPSMVQQLFTIATKENLLVPDSSKLLAIYHDNPQITDPENLRTSVGLTVPKGTVLPAGSDFGVLSISGRYAVGHFELPPTEFGQAWEIMYQWLMKGEYKPRDSFPFEVYASEPEKDTGKQELDIYLAIK